MHEITERTTVTVDGKEVTLPVGRIRDTDAVAYGLVPTRKAESVEKPAEEPSDAPKKKGK